jgi:hypothetical protein
MAHGDKSEEKEKDRSGIIVTAIVLVIMGLSIGGVVGGEMWKNRTHPTSELASYTGHEKLKLDPKGMDGTFARFDVVANATFAESLAKIWAANAQLIRIRVDTVERGGLVDITEEEKSNEVRYEFAAYGSSGGKSEGHGSEAPSHGSSQSYESLRLSFKRGTLTASSGSESPSDDIPAPTFGCSMSKLGDVIATSNMREYRLDFRNRRIRAGKDASGSTVYKNLWRWEASGSGGSVSS